MGNLVVCRDVSAEVEAEHSRELLQQRQKLEAIGRLAGGVAHDFNNLLVVIIGYSNIVLETLGEDHVVYEDVKEIHGAGERAAALTEQLLAFSRRQVLTPTAVDLNEVVRGISRLLDRLLGENIEIVTRLIDSACAVRADQNQLEQVVMNLAVNARDAMGASGTVTIVTSEVSLTDGEVPDLGAGVYACLSVIDTGEGMDEETQSLIFEPFFTTKELGKGTGLGLATVHGIVGQSGGQIVCVSELGAGTRFSVYLPKVEEVEGNGEPEVEDLLATAGETVLVVEDEMQVRKLICSLLLANHYKVLEASRPAQAVTIVESYEGRIDLLLTDVVMPKMDGIELAQVVREKRPETRVLFMSGYPEVLRAGIVVRTTAESILAKPFHANALLQAVRSVLCAADSKVRLP
jgi:two-component system, cell cycle sensor histidine kinase and response regulator CckA